MTPSTFRLLVVGLSFLPALLWALIARDYWSVLRTRRPSSVLFRLLFLVGGGVTVHYLLITVIVLIPGRLQGSTNLLRGGLFAALDGSVAGLVAVAAHLARVWPVRAIPPSTLWLATNYGVCGLAGALLMVADLAPGAGLEGWGLILIAFTVVLAVLGGFAMRGMGRRAHRGRWRGIAELRGLDKVAGIVGFLCILGAQGVPALVGATPLALTISTHPSAAAIAMFTLGAASGLILALPFALRDTADVLRGFLAAAAVLATVGLLYFGAPLLGARIADPELRRLLDVSVVVGLVLVLVLVRPAVLAAVDRVLLGRRGRRREELRAFLSTLAPELGTVECCRRALGELTRFFQLSSTAILLRDGTVVARGDLAVEGLTAVWPRGDAADALPTSSFGIGGMRELPLPLKEALVEADVIAAVPILGPRGRWGDLFIGAATFGATMGWDDIYAVETFAAQLALVLEAAELLVRAVAVERALAHAEKLAAIGELAARIVHEIRNPVTAARSLAQQLAGEPGSPFTAEHAIILAELERVERQVAALLRFARREEFRFEPVDVAELARATVDGFRSRLASAGVAVAVDAGGAVVARADREKLRQVLINLIENAMDALGEVPGARRLVVAVSRANGSGRLRVVDTGPGIPPDALPHVFEPFFSCKTNGTGLGLAVAWRTVDAHGGRIAATSAAGAGATFDVALPLAEER